MSRELQRQAANINSSCLQAPALARVLVTPLKGAESEQFILFYARLDHKKKLAFGADRHVSHANTPIGCRKSRPLDTSRENLDFKIQPCFYTT